MGISITDYNDHLEQRAGHVTQTTPGDSKLLALYGIFKKENIFLKF